LDRKITKKNRINSNYFSFDLRKRQIKPQNGVLNQKIFRKWPFSETGPESPELEG